jgi:hypothetical protein
MAPSQTNDKEVMKGFVATLSELLQFRELPFGFFAGGEVGAGIFREREENLVGGEDASPHRNFGRHDQ